MNHFMLLEPDTLDEAVELMAKHAGRIKPIAGGTDLIIDLDHGLRAPEYFLSTTSLEELNRITVNGETIVGAAVVLHRIDRSADLRRRYPAVSEAAALVGSRQIRNLATMGGNVCNAVPSADTAPALLAVNAEVSIQKRSGAKFVPLAEFFVGPRLTTLLPDEIVLGFRLPNPPPATGSKYLRHTLRNALDLAIVGVAAQISVDPDSGKISSAAIALGAVAPTPIRVPEAERLLTGNPLTDELLMEAAEEAGKASRPISDLRASADYRREMVRRLTCRTVTEAYQRATKSAEKEWI